MARGAFIFLILTQAAFAGERWTCVRSANFELYSESDEKTGTEALQFFEEVRRAFTETLGVKLPVNKLLTILAFNDEAEFAKYRPQENVLAFTMSTPRHDYIVMQDLNPEHYSVALHEYTHAIIRQSGMKLPLWLEEGFAEFYSTLKPVGNKILVGRIIPGRLQVTQSAMIDLRQVLNANQQSPLYHANNLVGVFYSESWSLLHMLKFSDHYAPHFDQFLDAIGHGEASDKALERVYGKPIDAIQVDLQKYVYSNRFRQGVIKARLAKPGPEPKPVPVDPVDVAVILAGVQVRGLNRQEGLQKLADLATDHPDRLGPVEALAWFQLAGSDQVAAITEFHRAFELGTRDANLCFEFAVKMRSVIPEREYVAVLRRATEIDPSFSAAQQLLAAHAFNAHDYAEAVSRLHLVKKLDRVNAFAYYRALSFAAFQIGNVAEAKSAADRAQQYAVSGEDKRQGEEMLKYVNGAAQTPGFGENPLPQL